MDETTVKVMAVMQVRVQVQMLSLVAVMERPDPHEPLGKQWANLSRLALDKKQGELTHTVANQIRLMAEMVETQDPTRAMEIVRELSVLDQLILTGLSELWIVPPHSTT